MLCGMRRAYALLDVKSIDDDARIIDGIASTPTPDRGGDIMEPKGAQFDLPMPFLWQHDQDQPIGEVFEATVTTSGIRIKARIAKIDEPSRLKDRLDEAWLSIKSKLVRGLSIGFKPIEAAFNEQTGGYHVLAWMWAETSAVTIPQNVEATILKVKQLDQAASGPHSSGVSDPLPVVRSTARGRSMQTINEQIASFENTRASKVAEMNAVMKAASDKGETLDKEQTEKYDGLALEVKAIDDHLPRLRDLEKTNVVAATRVIATTPETASETRGGVVVQVKSNVPKGTHFTRMVIAKALNRGSRSDAIAYAQSRPDWMAETPEVVTMLKAAVNIGTTTDPAWAAPLAVVRPLMDEILELLRPRTVVDRITGLRRVPFNVSVPIQNAPSTVAWVGEQAPKPVGQLGFTSTTLLITKVAGIVVISVELAKISNPSAEGVIREDLIREIAKYIDTQFLDPTVAGTAGVAPASITNGAQGIGTTGTSADNARTDIKNLIGTFTANLLPINESVFIMSEANAFALSGAITTLGMRPFPDISATGGSVLGVPVITSQVAGNRVILAHPPSILFADDGGVTVDVSQEASVEMSTTPTSPAAAAAVMVSLWQQNLIGLRAERFIGWKRARTTAVVYTTATYV